MIARGTTPTIEFTFSSISPTDINTAYLTIKQNKILKIEKNINEANIGDANISWNLTQEETLKLNEKHLCEIQIRYTLKNGIASISKVYEVETYKILKEGVI